MPILHISDIRSRVLRHFFQPAMKASDLIGRFVAVQIDPVSIVGSNQLLVLAARGSRQLVDSLLDCYERQEVLEVYAKERSLILLEDAPMIWPLLCERKNKKEELLSFYEVEIAYLRGLLTEQGVISARGIQSKKLSKHETWGPRFSGTMLLHLLWEIGDLIVVSRTGRDINYALARPDIWMPKNNKYINKEEARFSRWERYLEGVAIMDIQDTFAGFERCGISDRRKMMNQLVEAGSAVKISGVGRADNFCIIARHLLADPDIQQALSLPCFIPPLDNFIWNRRLVKDVWGMDYRWEIYTPPQKRQFGPYAMPLVTEDGLFGPVDFKLDRSSGVLTGVISSDRLLSLMSCDESMREATEAAAHKLAVSVGAVSIKLK